MNPQELADLLNGRQFKKEITEEEQEQAGKDGLVVIIGFSEDFALIFGSISEVVRCTDGGIILFKSGKQVEAIWGEDGYSWTYKTDIPHATFDIMEDDEKYCRGIVFHISSLQ